MFQSVRIVLSTYVKKKKRKKRKRNIGKYDSIKGGLCTYRSLWEKSFFEYLDKSDNVECFYSEKIKIPYISNKKSGKVRNYIPDVLVIYKDTKNSVIEIKPKCYLLKAINLKKFAAAKLWCDNNDCNFVILTEVELKNMGLL